jgi:hypothetical protein
LAPGLAIAGSLQEGVQHDSGLEGILTFDDVIELLSEELMDLAKLVATEPKRERNHAVR